MLYLIGTGLYYLTDLPVRALEKLRACDIVYLERYTNLNDLGTLPKLEGIINKKISIVEREDVESDSLIKDASGKNIALLVPGDPLAATTHVSLLIECKKAKINFEVLHASSIFSALGESGLSAYKFGGVCSIPIYDKNFRPESFFDVIEKNIKSGLHTLVLLEARDKDTFVDFRTALTILKEIEEKRQVKIIDWKRIVGMCRLGSSEQRIFWIRDKIDSYQPPLSMIICAELSKIEQDNISFLIQNI
jgi:diphthine synthase